MKEDNKKKIIIGSIVAIVFLLVIIIGATYAFFTLNISNSNTNTSVNIETGKLNNVTLVNKIKELHLSVNALDMSSTKQGTSYYATSDDNKNYLREDENHILTIAEIKVEGNITKSHTCTATLKVTKNGSMSTFLQEGDTELKIMGGAIHHTIDLANIEDQAEQTYNMKFYIEDNNPINIQAYLKLTNREADQKNIANKELSVGITIDNLNCDITENGDAIVLISKSPNLEDETKVSERSDVLRRFQGTAEQVNDNYICFGTNKSNECTAHADQYMYRIIGYAINADEDTNTQTGQIKIQKKEALESGVDWWNTAHEDIDWAGSNLHTQLLGQTYLENETYVPSEWKNKIAEHNWWYGDIIYTQNAGLKDGAGVFAIETGKANTEYYEYTPDGSGEFTTTPQNGQEIHYNYVTNQKWSKKTMNEKVGLINLSDYYLSQENGVTCVGNTSCINGWMHLSQNDSETKSVTKKNPPSVTEWMMTRMGFSIGWGYYIGLNVNGISGNSGYADLTFVLSIRPVLYLISGLELSGTGTITDPYIITN